MRQVRRKGQWQALRALWRVSSLKRVRNCCHHATGREAGIGIRLRSVEQRAHYSGLLTCGSIWCCPICSEKMLAGRVDELLAAIEAWVSRGGAVAMVTLTMRHRHGQALGALCDGLSDAWAAASGRNSRALRAELADVAGWVRRVECTLGRDGWHLHVHALLFLAPSEVPGEAASRSARSLTQTGRSMFAAWSSRLVARGFEAPEQGWEGST